MFRWSAAIALIGLSTFLIVGQWYIGIQASRRRKIDPISPSYSMIPLICGLIGAIGFLIAPSPQIRAYWWIPLLIDPCGILLFGSALVYWTWRTNTQDNAET